jgi:hypothetical protein
MKMSKFLLVIIFVTALCLLHVYQQTEIFRFAYAGQKKFEALEDLLDKNVILRYNIKKNTSLVRIGSGVSREADLEMPKTYRLVRLEQPKGAPIAKSVVNKDNIFVRLFGVTRQAEAKTINP